jgi:hypothetical protein
MRRSAQREQQQDESDDAEGPVQGAERPSRRRHGLGPQVHRTESTAEQCDDYQQTKRKQQHGSRYNGLFAVARMFKRSHLRPSRTSRSRPHPAVDICANHNIQ